VRAQTPKPEHQIVIYLFWGNGCPHCAEAKPFLENLAVENPNIIIREYEVWYIQENCDLFVKMAAAYGFEPKYVPTIMVGDRYWEGYTDEIAVQIKSTIEQCAKNGCRDRGIGIVPGLTASVTPPLSQPLRRSQSRQANPAAPPIMETPSMFLCWAKSILMPNPYG